MLSSVTLAPATDADWPQLRRWLARPEVSAWWGSGASAEAEITIALGASHGALARLILSAGTPVGYAQAADVTLLGSAPPDFVPAGTWKADLFIGSPEHRGDGIGAAALEALTREVFSTTLAVALALSVSLRNERAARAYEKAGFSWVGIIKDPAHGPCWIMLRQRPAAPPAPAGDGAAARPPRR